MRVESGKRFRQGRVGLPKKSWLGFAGRIEPVVGDRAAIEVLRPAVPRVLLDHDQVIRIVVDVAAAAHIRAVVAGPESALRVEVQTKRISQTPRNQLERRPIRIEPDDRSTAFRIAFYY